MSPELSHIELSDEVVPGTTKALRQLAALSPTCDLLTAGRAFGLGINASYDAYHRGEFPVEVIKIGRKLRVVTADLLAKLGLSADPAPGDDAA
jgi:hypothetical protein